jgi:hypothetical protein
MEGSWMVDGETSVIISSKSPSWQGARTEFLVPNNGFDGGGASELYLGKTLNPRYFQVRGYM